MSPPETVKSPAIVTLSTKSNVKVLVPEPVTLTVEPVPFMLTISVVLGLNPVKTISGLLPLVVGSVYVVLSLLSGTVTVFISIAVT